MRWHLATLGSLVFFVIVSVVALASSAMAQSSGGLEFVNDADLSIIFPQSETTGTRTVTIQNTSNEPLQPTFCIVESVESDDCNNEPITVSLTDTATAIDGTTARTVSLAFTWDSDDDFEESSGYLVLTSPESSAVSTKPIMISQERFSIVGKTVDWFKDSVALSTAIISVSALTAVMITAWILVRRRPENGWKAPEISTPAFSFTDSWATSLTSLGAVLGTVLGAGFLSDETQVMPMKTLIGLNVLFLILILIAPFIYNAFRTETSEDGKPIYRGKVWAFWLASGLTLWAVSGELITTIVLMEEIYQQRVLPDTGFFVLWGIIAVIGLLVAIYVVKQSQLLAGEDSARTFSPM